MEVFIPSCLRRFPSKPTPAPAGRFSSVCHQILWIYILHSPAFKDYLRRELPERFEIYKAGIIPGPDRAEMVAKLWFCYNFGIFRQLFRPGRPYRKNILKIAEGREKWQERGTAEDHLQTVNTKTASSGTGPAPQSRTLQNLKNGMSGNGHNPLYVRSGCMDRA